MVTNLSKSHVSCIILRRYPSVWGSALVLVVSLLQWSPHCCDTRVVACTEPVTLLLSHHQHWDQGLYSGKNYNPGCIFFYKMILRKDDINSGWCDKFEVSMFVYIEIVRNNGVPQYQLRYIAQSRVDGWWVILHYLLQ